MKKKFYYSKKIITILITIIMTFTIILVGCGEKSQTSEPSNKTETTDNDVVSVCTPPVEGDYETDIKPIIEEFENKNPNIKVDTEFVSWGESKQKFETALNAGNPPDLMFIAPNEKYIDTGLALSIDEFISKETLKDYKPEAVEYMKKEGKLYGLPLYMEPHTIGGNRKLLEEAGIDYKKIQQKGWTWKEFMEVCKKGTKIRDNGIKQYGFVFSASGVTATELLEHMLINNGLEAPIDEDGKYTYTNNEFLETLQFIVSLIDEGVMPAETNQITAQKRMDMFYTEQAMIVGKAMPYYESMVEQQNKETKEGIAPKGYKEVDFVLLPEPHKEGQEPVIMAAIDGYSVYRQKQYKGDEHSKNVVKALVALTSGKAGKSVMKLYLPQITNTGKKLFDDKYSMSDENKKVSELLMNNLLSSSSMKPDIAKNVILIKEQVIAPKFQALLAREITPEQMYEAVKNQAEELFK